MSIDSYTPRFSFEITEEQKDRINKTALSQYGLRKAIFNIILEDVLNMLETHGPGTLGVLLSGAAKPREIVPTLNSAHEAGKDDNMS